MKARRHGPVPAICGLLAFCFVLLSENMPRERSVAAFTLDAFGVLNKALKLGGQRSTEMCKLVKKETLVEGKDRGEPVRRFTFQAPVPVNVSTGLRQVMVVLAPAGLRMYSPTSEPRADGTFELVVRVYRKGAVSRWLDSLSLGDPVKMMWPWPCPLPEDRRNPGPRVGLIAFGIGVTELYRTAVQELADPNVEEVTLLYATRTWEEQQVLAPELEELQKREPKRFRLERILSREKRSRLRHVRVDPALLQEVFPWQDFSSEARFVCAGTSQMMDMAYEYLCDLGYEQDGYKLIRDAKLPSGFDLFKKLASLV